MKIEGFDGKFQVTGEEREKQPETTTPVKKILPEEKTKPSASFKLKEAFAASSQDYNGKKYVVAEQRIKLDARDTFDAGQVEKAYDDYIRVHKPETTVVVALKAHKPVIRGEEICIEIDNQLQQERLEALKINLQNALMRSLNNGFISLSLKFFDDKNNKEEKKLITAQDKLEHFVQQNPVVGKMCEMFGLQIE
ncbi:MAG: hypothetical protein K2P54_06160 [Odoribacter sp.]|nr:hypothetical protein [Odoribacter sp.]